jgi:hypothetical protein
MIAQLIRQDPAFRRLPFWMVMATVWATAAAGMIGWITVRRAPVGAEMLTALIWFVVVLYLVFGEIGTRTSSFNLSLPISGRDLWLAHVIAVTASGFVVLAIAVGMTTGSLVLIGRLFDELLQVKTLVALGGLLAAALLLAIGIIHMFRPAAQEVPMSLRRAGWSLLASGVPLALVLLLRPLGAFGLVVILGLAAATFVYAARAIPNSLSVPVERRRVPTDTGPGSWVTTQQGAGLWLALRVVHGVTTCAKKPVAIWFVGVFLLFLGFWVSGIDTRWSSSSQRFALPFMIVYTMMALIVMPIGGLGMIDWLPWSRRRSLALITLPMFMIVALGYGAGRVTDTIMGTSDKEVLCFVDDRDSGDKRFCVLLSECRIAWNGNVPEITSPWGEAHEPWNKPVVKGLPVRMYFPYDVPRGSSPEFAALQISRATSGVFGADIPPEEIQERYFVGKETMLTLQADYPELRRVGRAVYFPGIMGAVVILWSLLTAAYMRWMRAGVSEKKRKAMGFVFIALPMLMWVLDFVLEASAASEIAVRNAFIINLARSAGTTFIGTVTVWIAWAVIALAAYRLAERRFEKAEFGIQASAAQCNWV